MCAGYRCSGPCEGEKNKGAYACDVWVDVKCIGVGGTRKGIGNAKRRGQRLLGLEPRAALSTTHDRAHKRNETVRVLGRRHRTNLMLHGQNQQIRTRMVGSIRKRTLSADMPFHICSTFIYAHIFSIFTTSIYMHIFHLISSIYA